MKIGTLWFDNDKGATIAQKAEKAANYYRTKYGQAPNLCFVNPKAMADATQLDGLEIRPSRSVLPGHFWIGVKDQ